MIWSKCLLWAGQLSYSYGHHFDVRENDDSSTIIFISCIAIPFIFFPLYFFYLRYSQKHKIISWLGKKMPSKYSEFSFREIQTVLAVAMIKRDRHYFSIKKGRIRQFIREEYREKELDADEIIEVFLDGKIPLMDLIEWCNQFVSYEQKLETFLFLMNVASIDNELVDKEREYLLFIIQKFSIRNQDIPEEIQAKLFGDHNKKQRVASVSKFQSYYEILELTSTATAKELKESYRRLVKQFHPDSHPHLSVEEKQVLSDKFQKVQEAYDHLINS